MTSYRNYLIISLAILMASPIMAQDKEVIARGIIINNAKNKNLLIANNILSCPNPNGEGHFVYFFREGEKFGAIWLVLDATNYYPLNGIASNYAKGRGWPKADDEAWKKSGLPWDIDVGAAFKLAEESRRAKEKK